MLESKLAEISKVLSELPISSDNSRLIRQVKLMVEEAEVIRVNSAIQSQAVCEATAQNQLLHSSLERVVQEKELLGEKYDILNGRLEELLKLHHIFGEDKKFDWDVYQSLRAQIQSQNQIILELQNLLDGASNNSLLDEENSRLLSANLEMEERMNVLGRQLLEATEKAGDAIAWQLEAKQLRESLEKAEEKVNSLEKNFERVRAESTATKSVRDMYSEEKDVLKLELANVKAGLKRANEIRDKIEHDCAKVQSEFTKEIQDLKRKVQDLEWEKATLVTELGDLKEQQKGESDDISLVEVVEALQQEIDSEKAKYKAQGSEMALLKETLANMRVAHEKEVATIRREMSNSFDKLNGKYEKKVVKFAELEKQMQLRENSIKDWTKAYEALERENDNDKVNMTTAVENLNEQKKILGLKQAHIESLKNSVALVNQTLAEAQKKLDYYDRQIHTIVDSADCNEFAMIHHCLQELGVKEQTVFMGTVCSQMISHKVTMEQLDLDNFEDLHDRLVRLGLNENSLLMRIIRSEKYDRAMEGKDESELKKSLMLLFKANNADEMLEVFKRFGVSTNSRLCNVLQIGTSVDKVFQNSDLKLMLRLWEVSGCTVDPEFKTFVNSRRPNVAETTTKIQSFIEDPMNKPEDVQRLLEHAVTVGGYRLQGRAGSAKK